MKNRNPVLLRFALTGLLIFAACFCAFIQLNASVWPTPNLKTIAASEPRPSGLFRVGPVPMTGSMRPAIHGGEYLYAEWYTGQPLYLGDVVATGVLHMATVVNATHIRTSGIANHRSDPYIKKSRIKFIVRYVVRPSPAR